MAGAGLAFAAMLVLAGYFLLQSRAMLHDRAADNEQVFRPFERLQAGGGCGAWFELPYKANIP